MSRVNTQPCKVGVAVGYPLQDRVLDVYTFDGLCPEDESVLRLNAAPVRDADGDIAYSKKWNLTHQPTYHALVVGLPSKKLAEAALATAIRLGFDQVTTKDVGRARSELKRLGAAEFSAEVGDAILGGTTQKKLLELIKGYEPGGRPSQSSKAARPKARKPRKKPPKKKAKAKKAPAKKTPKKRRKKTDEPDGFIDIAARAEAIRRERGGNPGGLAPDQVEARNRCLW